MSISILRIFKKIMLWNVLNMNYIWSFGVGRGAFSRAVKTARVRRYGRQLLSPGYDVSLGTKRPFSNENTNCNKSFTCLSCTKLALLIPSVQDMEEVGELLSTLLLEEEESSVRGTIVFLEGDLGAGKVSKHKITAVTAFLHNTLKGFHSGA